MLGALFAGKYAAYVWPAYGVSFVGLMLAAALTWWLYRQAQRQLARTERETGRESPSKADD